MDLRRVPSSNMQGGGGRGSARRADVTSDIRWRLRPSRELQSEEAEERMEEAREGVCGGTLNSTVRRRLRTVDFPTVVVF